MLGRASIYYYFGYVVPTLAPLSRDLYHSLCISSSSALFICVDAIMSSQCTPQLGHFERAKWLFRTHLEQAILVGFWV
jgi:hypothetical protein